MGLPSDQELLRQTINMASPGRMCPVQMAALAVDTSYSGFEDPRVAADMQLGRLEEGGIAVCERFTCDGARVRVDRANSDFTVEGSCELLEKAVGGFCLSKAWETQNHKLALGQSGDGMFKELDDRCEFRAGSGSAGHFCPQLNCGFSAGFSEDGIKDTAGECAKEKGDPIGSDLPVSEIAVTISSLLR